MNPIATQHHVGHGRTVADNDLHEVQVSVDGLVYQVWGPSWRTLPDTDPPARVRSGSTRIAFAQFDDGVDKPGVAEAALIAILIERAIREGNTPLRNALTAALNLL